MQRGLENDKRAFSTGRAARYCYVTPETILNWIRAGLLKAQRTAGGQYRIRVEELRRFMVEQGMQTDQLDASQSIRPHCWESRLEEAAAALPVLEPCRECLVRRSGTLNCWELAGLLPLTGRRAVPCAQCSYYLAFGPSGREGGERSWSDAKGGSST